MASVDEVATPQTAALAEAGWPLRPSGAKVCEELQAMQRRQPLRRVVQLRPACSIR